jgi:hypothetical protein
VWLAACLCERRWTDELPGFDGPYCERMNAVPSGSAGPSIVYRIARSSL